MKLTALAPTLWTAKLPETIAFYRDTLGFECIAEMRGWACLERDGIEIMLSLPNEHEGSKGPNFSGSFYFRCDSVEMWWESLRDRANVVYPIESFDYGMREFAIRDNNGYMLQFGEEIQ